MKKQVISLMCLIFICVAMLSPTYASNTEDVFEKTTLTLNYQKEDQVFSDLQISIYRIAELLPDGTYALVEPFASYPIKIYDIKTQEQWKDIASTLSSYVVADQLEPYMKKTTDDLGTVTFENAETGLYLVSEVMAENKNGTYFFDRFMIYLPTPMQDGTFDYTVQAEPKCVKYVPKNEYKVTKLWQDSGYQNDRPKEVLIDIYKDGVMQETCVLSEDNNWSYIWQVSDYGDAVWTVAERSVSDRYTVMIKENGNSFSVINIHSSDPETPKPPLTGDSFNLPLCIAVMCISGIVLMILGIYGKRCRKV